MVWVNPKSQEASQPLPSFGTFPPPYKEARTSLLGDEGLVERASQQPEPRSHSQTCEWGILKPLVIAEPLADCNLVREPRQSLQQKSTQDEPKWSTDSWEIIHYCLRPLHFRVVFYVAIDNERSCFPLYWHLTYICLLNFFLPTRMRLKIETLFHILNTKILAQNGSSTNIC